MSAATLRSFPAASLVISSAFYDWSPRNALLLTLRFVFNSSFLIKKEGKIMCDLVTFATGRREKATYELLEGLFNNSSHFFQKNLNSIRGSSDIMRLGWQVLIVLQVQERASVKLKCVCYWGMFATYQPKTIWLIHGVAHSQETLFPPSLSLSHYLSLVGLYIDFHWFFSLVISSSHLCIRVSLNHAFSGIYFKGYSFFF